MNIPDQYSLQMPVAPDDNDMKQKNHPAELQSTNRIMRDRKKKSVLFHLASFKMDLSCSTDNLHKYWFQKWVAVVTKY